MKPETLHYPPARRDDTRVEIHGRSLPDPYRWLENPDDPDARAWLKAQNDIAAQYLDSLPSRKFFVAQVEEQFRHGLISLPILRGSRTFLIWRQPTDELLKLYVREEDGPWTALVDPETMDPDLLTILEHADVSPDGTKVSYLLSRGGDEVCTLHVIDSVTGQSIAEPIDRCHALYTQLAWKPDSSGFYYCRSVAASFGDHDSANGSAWRLHDHDLDRGVSGDVELLGSDGRPSDAYHPVASPDGRHLVVEITDMMPGQPGQLLVADLERGPEHLVPLDLGGAPAEVHSSFAADGRLYLRTLDGAPYWRLARVDLTTSDRRVEAVIDGVDGDVLKYAAVLDDVIVCSRTVEDVGRLVVYDKATGQETGLVPVPGDGTIGGPIAGPHGGNEVWFHYGDFVTAGGVWHYTLGATSSTPWLIPEGSDGSDVTVERVDFPSHDGVPVPLLIFRSGPMTGPRPAIVYAYGGFGLSLLRPAFDHWATAWSAAGGVYAVVGARGGGERGEQWHQAGSRQHKFNTYEDFNAAARWLVANGYTTHDQVAAGGVSQGGLSVAAAVCRDPANWAAAVPCAMGVDLLRPLRSGNIWAEEYGDGRDPVEFEWLLRDSPYYNVEPGTCYPATLVCAFGHDTRTVPSEGHKWAALMQWAGDCDRPMILRHEQEAGHSTRSVSQMVGLLADWLAFVAENTGLEV